MPLYVLRAVLGCNNGQYNAVSLAYEDFIRFWVGRAAAAVVAGPRSLARDRCDATIAPPRAARIYFALMGIPDCYNS